MSQQNNKETDVDLTNVNNDQNKDNNLEFTIVESVKPKLPEREYRRHSNSSSSAKRHKHHSRRKHRSKRHKEKKPAFVVFLRTVFILMIVLVVGVASSFAVLHSNGNKSLTTVAKELDLGDIVEHNGHLYQYNNDLVSVAFIGVDKEELGNNGEIGTAGQNDTDMVLVFDKSTGKATLLCIPRETMVDVDIYSKTGNFINTENVQLCLAFAYGNGKDTSCENVTTSLKRILYGVPIEKYFALDLSGIGAINDSMGGVTVDSLYDFKEQGIKVGDNVHIKGDFAETYVRLRDMEDLNSSLNRLERQKQYLKAFVNQTARATLSDFSTIKSLYDASANYSYTNLSLSDLTYFASTAISKGVTSFDTITLEGKMKPVDTEIPDIVNAAFYPDKDKLYETVLNVFYSKIS